MRNIRCPLSLLLLALFLQAHAVESLAQDASKEVEVKLSLADGRTVYRTGDPIKLVLSFTATMDDYLLNTSTTKPASPVDALLIAPADKVTRWLDEYSGSNRYSPDYANVQTLSTNPARVVLYANAWFRFDRPGRYTVRVKTRRVARRRGADGIEMERPLELTTNEVSFEVKAMTDAEEEQEVLRLASQLDAVRDWRVEDRITEELSYLAGDISTREKVRRFINSDGRSGNYSENIWLGLFIARNRALVIKLLEAAFRDTEVEVSQSFINLLARLRVLQEKAAASGAKKQPAQDDEARTKEIQQAYLKELAASLSKRTGKSRSAAAMTILLLLPKDKPEGARLLATVRDILLQDFEQLHPFTQEYLLNVYWEQVRDPSLIPLMERIIAQHKGPQGQIMRTTAIKRLMEMSRERARPFIIAELQDPYSLADFEVLKSLDEATLPEIDGALLAQVRELAESRDPTRLKHKALLVARYASAAIYKELMEIYRASHARWQPDARASFLAYFARHDEKEALPLIEEALTELQPTQDFTFFLELIRNYYSSGLDALLQKRLASDDPAIVGTAAYIMSLRGPASDRDLIEARLTRWLNEWRGRAAELEADKEAVHQKMVQVNLILAITQAKGWKVSDEQARQLKQGCITQLCRQHFQLK